MLATLSKTCLPNHPPLLFELVFDEGRRIATAASIPDISSGDRHRGALHSVGTGSKSIVLLSRNTVSATLSKTGLPNHPPLLFELVFDEGRRIATAASIPDISSGDRHCGALHSVGTGSKSIVFLLSNRCVTVVV